MPRPGNSAARNGNCCKRSKRGCDFVVPMRSAGCLFPIAACQRSVPERHGNDRGQGVDGLFGTGRPLPCPGVSATLDRLSVSSVLLCLVSRVERREVAGPGDVEVCLAGVAPKAASSKWRHRAGKSPLSASSPSLSQGSAAKPVAGQAPKPKLPYRIEARAQAGVPKNRGRQHRMGRRAHKPDPSSRRQVEALAGYGVPEQRFAEVIGVDPKTLRKHYPQGTEAGPHQGECQGRGEPLPPGNGRRSRGGHRGNLLAEDARWLARVDLA